MLADFYVRQGKKRELLCCLGGSTLIQQLLFTRCRRGTQGEHSTALMTYVYIVGQIDVGEVVYCRSKTITESYHLPVYTIWIEPWCRSVQGLVSHPHFDHYGFSLLFFSFLFVFFLIPVFHNIKFDSNNLCYDTLVICTKKRKSLFGFVCLQLWRSSTWWINHDCDKELNTTMTNINNTFQSGVFFLHLTSPQLRLLIHEPTLNKTCVIRHKMASK